MKPYSHRLLLKALVVSSCLGLFVTPVISQDDAAKTDDSPAGSNQQDITPELIRSFLHLQEQVHATQLAVERTRIEAEAAATRNTEALNGRLKALEDALDKASEADTAKTDAIIESNRQAQKSNSIMTILGAFTIVVVAAALGFAAWLQWKTVTRLASLPATTALPALLPPQSAPVLESNIQRPQIGSTRLMEALDKLEHRIVEMEENSHSSRPLKPATTDISPHHVPTAGIQGATTEPTNDLGELIQEGEELLAREEAEKAIAHFDSILAKHPGNPEVLLRKGTALERLHRDQEAIECYDLAIKADNGLTMAYLHKGGLFNRMERFGEAMECYEQALRVQENRREG